MKRLPVFLLAVAVACAPVNTPRASDPAKAECFVSTRENIPAYGVRALTGTLTRAVYLFDGEQLEFGFPTEPDENGNMFVELRGPRKQFSVEALGVRYANVRYYLSGDRTPYLCEFAGTEVVAP